MSPNRRLSHVCRHLLTHAPCAGTATATRVELELKAILATLGDEPLPAESKKMIYVADSKKLPPLEDRGYIFTGGKPPAPDLVDRIHQLCPSSEDESVSSEGTGPDALHVVKGMLLHATDCLDESHNSLVKVFRRKEFALSDARIDSAYAHMLLHRQEGECLSAEGISKQNPDGLPGFLNAKYWINNTETGGEKVMGQGFKGLPMTPHPIYPMVFEEAKKLAAGNPKLEALFEKMPDGAWNARACVDYCMKAYKEKDPEKLEFLRKLYNTEWRILLAYCASKAGIQLDA